MNDLEVLFGEALGLGEVLGEPLRDGDVDVRERAHRAIGEAEPAPLSELVEAVLRRQPKRDARNRAGELSVGVGVNEVRMQDSRASACEVRRHLSECDRVDVCPQPDVVERDAALAQRSCELPRAGLILVEHEEANVPAPLAQVGKQLQEMCLRAGDARDLLRMQHDAVHHESPAASRMPRAHDCTE